MTQSECDENDDLDAFFDEVDEVLEEEAKKQQTETVEEVTTHPSNDTAFAKQQQHENYLNSETASTVGTESNNILRYNHDLNQNDVHDETTSGASINNNNNNSSSARENTNVNDERPVKKARHGVVVVSKKAITAVGVSIQNSHLLNDQQTQQQIPSFSHNINTMNTTASLPLSSSSLSTPTLSTIPPSSQLFSSHLPQQQSTTDPNTDTKNTTNTKPAVRTAAGKTWIDPSLSLFPENDYRLFIGNLAKDINDAKLAEVFSSKYSSFAMARVCYDSHTNVSKGYGFVSLMDPMECARAIREMDQSWLGSRPIKVKRSDWKERDLKEKMKQDKKREKKNRRR